MEVDNLGTEVEGKGRCVWRKQGGARRKTEAGDDGERTEAYSRQIPDRPRPRAAASRCSDSLLSLSASIHFPLVPPVACYLARGLG